MTYLFYAALAYFAYKAIQHSTKGSRQGAPSDAPRVGGKKKKKKGKAPHVVLGVDEDASKDEIKAAYQKQISQYHPDKVANAAVELKDLAEKRSKEINAAYEALMARR